MKIGTQLVKEISRSNHEKMRWLEIIELRTVGRTTDAPQRMLQTLVEDMRRDQDNPEARLYESYTLDSDYSIHLTFDGSGPKEIGSALGVRIASLLRPHGSVSHTLWSQDEMNHEEFVTTTENE